MAILVNGEQVDDEVIRGEASAIKERLLLEMPEEDDLARAVRAREWARENVIERVLLRQAARQETASDEAEAVQRLLTKITADVRRPTSKEVAKIYQETKDSFYLPELLRASHIIKNVDETTSETEASAAIAGVADELRRGVAFETLADSHSDCPGQGGDLGYFARGRMVAEFEAVVFALRVGEISGIFRSTFGFHIAKLVDRKPAGIRPLAEVRKDLEEQIWNQRKQQRIELFLDELRARADIRKVSAAKPEPAP